MKTNLPTAICVFGPTASGKTALGINLANALNGEIINADSRQIYQKMPIITAMPSADEFAAAPHHLFSFLKPNKKYSVTQYLEDASKTAEEITSRGRTPIFLGGTGFYLKVLMEGISQTPEVPEEILNELNQQAEEQGLETLVSKLQQVDPEICLKIDLKNKQRVLRALSVYEATGTPFSEFQNAPKEGALAYNFVKVGIMPEREVMYERINNRFDKMLEAGVLQEAQNIINAGYETKNAGVSSIGLKDFFLHIAGEISLQEAADRTAKDQRNYAKRQCTWMRTQYQPGILIQGPQQVGEVLSFIKA